VRFAVISTTRQVRHPAAISNMLYVEQIININGTQASDTLEWCSNCDPTLDIFFKYL
jgi:hypothetical protein